MLTSYLTALMLSWTLVGYCYYGRLGEHFDEIFDKLDIELVRSKRSQNSNKVRSKASCDGLNLCVEVTDGEISVQMIPQKQVYNKSLAKRCRE